MFGLGATELLLILVIVLVLFGTKKLSSLGSDLGSAIKGFRSAISTTPADKPIVPPEGTPADGMKVIDGEVDRQNSKL